ncbi:MAG: tRNA (N(6)-L-threonylcarbamoyladenosine(37)-C(2))-methylthiotransferase MtaB [Clostridia bacterium]|nr:tRNA (N(6)-L-threonylcarbamoyladenosine(37)-C(2))-methylthiotransferase MtaB [Clostridia bacterium]
MNVRFYTLGCKVNQYESEQMRCLLEKSPLADTDVDIYIVNSCTVTAESSRKTRQALNRIRKDNPDSVLVLTGCYPQAFPEEAAQTVADIVTGNRSNIKIVELIFSFLQTGKRVIAVEDHEKNETYTEFAIDDFSGHTRAFIKIQDGCNRFCSYCIIPYARGRSRSRKLEDIEAELKTLASKGYREVVLTGIDLSVYGADIGCDLADAVTLAQSIDGIDRIRLGSLEPDKMTGMQLSRFADCDKFCPQFHLSLQSGSDAVLKRMNRHYTSTEYANLCEQIRTQFADAVITTDIITGFPGETEEDFSQTIEFVKQIGFEKVHVFPYSERSGTRAVQFDGRVEKKVREARARELTQVCNKIRQQFLLSQIGKTVEVLFETPKNGIQQGFTANYTPVQVVGRENLCGRTLPVYITAAEYDACIGELTE